MAIKPADLAQIEATVERGMLKAFSRLGIDVERDRDALAWARRFDYLKDRADASRWLQQQVQRKGILATLGLLSISLVLVIRYAPVGWLERLAELFTGTAK